MAVEGKAALRQFFLKRYSVVELQTFITDYYAELRGSIPFENGTLDQVASAAVDALERRGRIDDALFEHLRADRGFLAKELASIQQMLKSTEQAAGSEASSGAQSPVPAEASRDAYINQGGQVGAMGPGAVSSGNTYVQGAQVVHVHHGESPDISSVQAVPRLPLVALIVLLAFLAYAFSQKQPSSFYDVCVQVCTLDDTKLPTDIEYRKESQGDTKPILSIGSGRTA